MKTIKKGLVAAALALAGCASQEPRLQNFTELIRSQRPLEEATMEIAAPNGKLTTVLYLAGEGYRISLDNVYFIHTEAYGNALFYRNPRVSYTDDNCDGNVDYMFAEGEFMNVNDSKINDEYKKALLSIGQDRINRVWEWRWR